MLASSMWLSMASSRPRQALASSLRASVTLMQRLHTRRRVDVSLPITARQAFDVAFPAVLSKDEAALLRMITCGERIRSNGTADLWTLLFDFPALRARGVLGVGIDEDARTDADLTVCYFTEVISPFRGPPRSILGELLGSDPWRSELSKAGALPVPFKDSPEATKELAAQGVDYVAGSTSLNLAGLVLLDGRPVWRTQDRDREYYTSWLR